MIRIDTYLYMIRIDWLMDKWMDELMKFFPSSFSCYIYAEGIWWNISFKESHLGVSAIPAERSSPWGLYSNLAGNLYSSSLFLILFIIFTRKHCVTVTKQRKSSSEVPFSHYRLSEKETVSIYQFHACHRPWKTFPFFAVVVFVCSFVEFPCLSVFSTLFQWFYFFSSP